MASSPNPNNNNDSAISTSTGLGSSMSAWRGSPVPSHSSPPAGRANFGQQFTSVTNGMVDPRARPNPAPQYYSGPITSYNNIFTQPGDYNVTMNFSGLPSWNNRAYDRRNYGMPGGQQLSQSSNSSYHTPRYFTPSQ